MVLVSPLVKICDFFFFTTGVSDASKPRRRRVGATSVLCRSRVGEAKKKKKKDTPDTGIQRVIPVLVSDTCRTPTRRQKWRVHAT